MLHLEIIPHLLYFREPAGTSRGIYTTRKVWYICLSSAANPVSLAHLGGANFFSNLADYLQKREGQLPPFGLGECAPLPALSCDDLVNYDEVLQHFCAEVARTGELPRAGLRPYPSMLFGLECALQHYNQYDKAGRGDLWLPLWENSFTRSHAAITINGLIWMGDFEEMLGRIEEKISEGYRCVKLKIGAIDFEREIALLQHIRHHFPAPAIDGNREGVRTIELRVDANGAFSSAEAMEKLMRLAELQLHSIEQPIKAGDLPEMTRLCQASPLAIALDEELIGINGFEEKERLLDTIQPQYIILKPSLHGGISGCDEWINLAKARNIGYWITSALESNVGLNAIAQWCGTQHPTAPQGLGTGKLFVENIASPLCLTGDQLWFKR